MYYRLNSVILRDAERWFENYLKKINVASAAIFFTAEQIAGAIECSETDYAAAADRKSAND
jgi:hypothetical protein